MTFRCGVTDGSTLLHRNYHTQLLPHAADGRGVGGSYALDAAVVGEYTPQFQLFTCAAVILELQQGSSEKTAERLELIAGLELLDSNDAVEQIVATYIERRVMPNDPGGDALHLAVASHYRMDVLLTWNCRHLANPNKMGHIRAVNRELSNRCLARAEWQGRNRCLAGTELFR